MDKERFSLLLLEPNEIYFEDFLANLIDEQRTASDEPVRDGHLKMCSKSIIFDPKDKMEPIVKIVYKDCKKLYKWPGKLDSKDSNVLAVDSYQHTEILDRNVLAPYTLRNERRVFLFSMQNALIKTLLQHLSQLHKASSLKPYKQNDMIAMIVFSRHKRCKFDPLWLNDIYEGIIVENTVDEIKPLITNPGRLLLSTKAIYFQPYNNIQPYPVKKISLKSLESLTKRRFLLRHISLEIVWKDSSNDKTDTLYVAFRKETDRNSFYDKTMAQDGVAIAKIKPETMTLKWQNGAISNYEYLLYLNSLADRTFHDLTQYPIFPWIISDYTSNELNLEDEKCYRDLTKPMGALNPERLNRLKERFDEMGDPKFLYGSHYSAPGLVLFYLVRKHPKLMLCLQNGRFDHPDRMFNKMSDVYADCLNNMSDFKELIPEFYDTSKKGDFLLNDLKINFGTRHDGTPVNHVQLPPWAKDSPEYFVETFRKALESDYVSQNLNHWIDLIFGYKQRGEEAIKANNLFFHLCYEGSVDLHETNDLRARYALEKKISEFGQIPKQLFDKPHVPRTRSPSLKETSDIAECGSTKSRLKDHSQNVVSYAIVNEQTAGKDESLQLFDMKWNRQAIHKCESVDFYHFEWSTFAKTFVTETSTKADVLFGLIHFVLVKVHRLAARGGDDDNGVGSTLLPHYWKCSATQYLSRYSTLTGDFVTLRGNLENDEIELELVTENKGRTTRLKVDKIESIEKDAFLCDHCPSYLQIFSQISKDLCLPKKPNWQTHNDESNGWRGVLSGIHVIFNAKLCDVQVVNHIVIALIFGLICFLICYFGSAQSGVFSTCFAVFIFACYGLMLFLADRVCATSN